MELREARATTKVKELMIQIEIDDVTVNRRLSPSPYAPELMFNESDASFRLHSFMRNVTRILLLFRSFSFV